MEGLGAAWVTGYSLCGESTGFGWKFFKENWWLMLTRMDTGGLILLFPLGLVGLAYLAIHDAKRGLLLGLWAVPGLYCTALLLGAARGWTGIRAFFRRVFPPLILSALALLCYAVRARPWCGRWDWARLWPSWRRRTCAKLPTNSTARWTGSCSTRRRPRGYVKTEDGAVIVASDRLLNFIEFAGDWHLYPLETFDRGRDPKQNQETSKTTIRARSSVARRRSSPRPAARSPIRDSHPGERDHHQEQLTAGVRLP